MNRFNAYSPRQSRMPLAFLSALIIQSNSHLNDDSDVQMYSSAPQYGSRGADVVRLQTMLIRAGYNVGVKGADGIFGNDTSKALNAYQRAKGFPVSNTVTEQVWTQLSRDSGMTKPATVQPVPMQQAQAPSLPQAQPLAQTSQPPQNASAPDFWQTLMQIGQKVPEVAQSVQRVVQAGQQVLGNNPAATPPTVAQQTIPQSAPQQSGIQQSGIQKTGSTPQVQTQGQGQQEPDYTYVVVEPPLKTAARYGVPTVLGVTAGIAAHQLMEKPSLVLSIVIGTATTVGAFVAGNMIFPPTEQQLTEEQVRLLDAQSEARRQAA